MVSILASCLKVAINPSLILFTYILYGALEFGEFSVFYSKTLIFSFLLDQGLSLFIATQGSFKNKISAKYYMVIFILVCFGGILFCTPSELFFAVALSWYSIVTNILRRRNHLVREVLAHSYSLLLSFAVLLYWKNFDASSLAINLGVIRLTSFFFIVGAKNLQTPFSSSNHIDSLLFLFPFWLQSISAVMFSNVDTLIFSEFFDLNSVGLYKLIATVLMLGLFPFEMVNGYFIPKLANSELVPDARLKWMKRYKISCRYLAIIIGISLSIVFVTLDSEFIFNTTLKDHVYINRFEVGEIDGIYMLLILFVVFYFSRSASNYYANMLTILGYQKLRVALLLSLNIAYLVMVIVVAKYFDIIFAIYTLVIHSLIQMITYRLICLRKELRV